MQEREEEFLEEDEAETPAEQSTHEAPTYYPCSKRLLTHEQEISLSILAQEGDEDARRQIMESNLRLVMSIARRYRGRSLGYEDMIQEGIIGLLEAIRKYDWTRGHRFSTYATFWIRQSIVRAIEKTDRMIRLPAHGCNAERAVAKVEKEYWDELGRQATVEEVMAKTGFSRPLVQALYMFGSEPLSLDASMGENGESLLTDVIPDPYAIDPEENSVDNATRMALIAAVAALTNDKERFVIERRFGLGDGTIWSLKELSVKLEMSREGVRHIEVRALKKLREYLRGNPAFEHRPTFYSSSI